MTDMRKYLLGSLIAHVGLTVVGSLLSAFFLSAPPSLRVMKLDLQNLSLPETQAPAEPETQTPPAEAEPEAAEPEPAEAEPEPVVPSPPAELPPRAVPMEVETDSGVPETETPPDLRAPEPLLPREPKAVEKTEEKPEPVERDRPSEEDVDFLEPEAVAPQTEATPEAEAEPEPVEGTQTDAEEVTQGGMVQAHSPEGVSDFYLARVQQKIGRRWRPTPGLVPGREAAECLVHFRIGTEGEVIAPSVARSSGLTVFDRQALRAVIESGPLPPVPPRFAKTGLEIRFLFSYSP